MTKIITLIAIMVLVGFASRSQVPVMVQDINQGINSTDASPSGLYPWNGYLYFFSNDSIHGSELWRYNEMSSAAMVQDYIPGPQSIEGGGWAGNPIAAYKSKLFFAGEVANSTGRMYTYNGTGLITLANGFPANKFSNSIANLTVIGDKLYFTADSASMNFLWQYDGSTAPHMIRIPTGSVFGPCPGKLVAYKGKYYFQAYIDNSNRQLHVLDTATNIVNAVAGKNYVVDITVAENMLYLTCVTDATGRELHSFDGTTFRRLTTITSGMPMDPVSGPLTYYDSSLYFTVELNAWGVYELFRYNLRTNTYGIVNSIPGLFDVDQLIVYKKNLYIVAATSATGLELWKYDGTSGTLVADINPGPSNGLSHYPINLSTDNSLMTIFNNHLYFRATDGVHGMELWRLNDPTGIQRTRWPGEAYLYPNPTASNATLHLTLSKAQSLQVSLSAVNGSEVYNSRMQPYRAGNNSHAIPMEALPAGQYFYRVLDEQGSLAAAGTITKK